MDCAIPLITIDDSDHSFVVNDEAIALLSSIESKVCITAVAGLYRTGKSALLNWLANRSKGFNVGPTINRCTRGIWLWGEPIMCTTQSGEKCACIILDTEGLGGVESNLKYDTRIFSLVILLCSTLVYNSMGSINENAISNLSLVTQLSENIKLSNKPDDSNTDDALEFHKVFPSFIWVIRDFTLELEDEDGYDITPTQYLNTALEQSPGYDKQTMERNRIRHMLTSFFPDRECVTLIRPINDEEKLQQVDDIPYDDLREEFREGMSELRSLIFDSARPKTIDGKMLTGAMFGGLVRAYVKAINDGGVPTISSAWEGVSQQECLDAKNAGLVSYRTFMDSTIVDTPFPIESEELLEKHSKSFAEAMQLYHQRAVGPSAKIIIQEFENEMQAALRKYDEENKSACELFCDNLFTDLFDSLIRIKLLAGGESSEQPEKQDCLYATDMQQFRQDWDALVNLYAQQSRGPSKWKILSEALKLKMIDCSNVIINFITSDYEGQISTMHQDVQDSTSKLSKLDAEFHVLKDNSDKTDVRNKVLEAQVIEMEVSLSSQNKKMTELSQQSSELLIKYDEERDLRARNEEKMEKSKKRVSELESFEGKCFELNHEKDALEMRVKELEEEVHALKQKKKKCVIS